VRFNLSHLLLINISRFFIFFEETLFWASNVSLECLTCVGMWVQAHSCA